MRHIIYIPGLGDKYDVVRKIGLKLWRRPGVRVSHLPMRWEDPQETYEQKLVRLETLIEAYPDARVILVGESAGGSVTISATRRFKDVVDRSVTVCGMNYGASNVNPSLYSRNVAFRDAMIEADRTVATLSKDERAKLLTIYSSMDFTVRPKNTLIDGVASRDLKVFGHMQAILLVLFVRFGLILK